MTRIGSLAFDEDLTLYGIRIGWFPELFTIDPTTGKATLVGKLSSMYFYEGGMAFGRGGKQTYGVVLTRLYACDSGVPRLSTVPEC